MIRTALSVVALITILVGSAFLQIAVERHQALVPVCPEDSVAVGAPGADYVGGFGWSEYRCLALDDITAQP